MKKYIVKLNADQRRGLVDLVKVGNAPAYRIQHANILLKADQSEDGQAWKDVLIAEAFHCTPETVGNVRRRFAKEGFEAAIGRKNKGVGRPRILDGDAEAKLTTIACSEAPDGRQRWTVRMIAERMVELNVVESCSHMTIQHAMKKRVEAVASEVLGHSPQAKRSVCCGDGRCTFNL